MLTCQQYNYQFLAAVTLLNDAMNPDYVQAQREPIAHLSFYLKINFAFAVEITSVTNA